MSNRIPPQVGDRVQIVGAGVAMLGGMEGEIVEVYEGNERVHVRVAPYKETAWLGGRDYSVPAENLQLLHRL